MLPKRGLMEKKYYAHSFPGKPPEEWQPLEELLRNVAELARSFAKSFGAGVGLIWKAMA